MSTPKRSIHDSDSKIIHDIREDLDVIREYLERILQLLVRNARYQ
jgi:hypothetical protein